MRPFKNNVWFLPPVSKNAQQHEEEIDKIKIKRQSAYDGSFTMLLRALGHVGTHIFNLLGIIGHQTCKNKNTHVGSDPVQPRAIQKDVYNGSNYQTNKQHKQEAAKFGKIISREIAICTHEGKHATANEKGSGNGAGCVNQENNRKGKTVDDGIYNK